MAGSTAQNNTLRMIAIGVLVVGVFFGAYRFASARSGQAAPNPAAGSSATSDSGCACCGGASTPTKNGISGEAVEGAAKVGGNVQTISVDVGSVYNPNVIKLKAGVPAEITFSQSSGCTAQVQSVDLGFSEDLAAGPKTVKLPAPEAGTYAFSCGMDMVFGKIVVE